LTWCARDPRLCLPCDVTDSSPGDSVMLVLRARTLVAGTVSVASGGRRDAPKVGGRCAAREEMRRAPTP
jgi:hypothetical protein